MNSNTTLCASVDFFMTFVCYAFFNPYSLIASVESIFLSPYHIFHTFELHGIAFKVVYVGLVLMLNAFILDSFFDNVEHVLHVGCSTYCVSQSTQSSCN